jgi:Heparinase II/III-like protein
LQTDGRPGAASALFRQAGTCVLRNRDLYLLVNASGVGLRGRGAHSHNDALSVEVAACGVSFLTDPGTYVYTSDLPARHLFRSTAYHSTVEVDGEEQNQIRVDTPFLMGDDAKPRIVQWESNAERDLIVAEHDGYRRLPQPLTHRRAVHFNKREGFWLIEDSLLGSGVHDFRFYFQIAAEREVAVREDHSIEIRDPVSGALLLLASLNSVREPALQQRWSSRNYGSRVQIVAACWTQRTEAPFTARWLLLPARAGEDARERLELIARAESQQPGV